ncbi:hypothetical protein LXL04_034529 [Taraxacum kok-saghyz]
MRRTRLGRGKTERGRGLHWAEAGTCYSPENSLPAGIHYTPDFDSHTSDFDSHTSDFDPQYLRFRFFGLLANPAGKGSPLFTIRFQDKGRSRLLTAWSLTHPPDEANEIRESYTPDFDSHTSDFDSHTSDFDPQYLRFRFFGLLANPAGKGSPLFTIRFQDKGRSRLLTAYVLVLIFHLNNSFRK